MWTELSFGPDFLLLLSQNLVTSKYFSYDVMMHTQVGTVGGVGAGACGIASAACE